MRARIPLLPTGNDCCNPCRVFLAVVTSEAYIPAIATLRRRRPDAKWVRGNFW